MTRPTHLAFLGCGSVAHLHSRTLQRFKRDVQCHYASRDHERARALSDRFGGHAFPSYEAALSSGEIDAVVIGLPPSHHLAWTLQALDAGKHVIVEKPAFPRSTDVETVAARAAEAGRRVLVAENYFYKPLAAVLRQLLAAGVVGEPRFIHLNAMKRQKTGDWRDDSELAGGGALFEGGIHWINLLANLGMAVRRVTGHRLGERSHERSMLVALEYDNDAVATLQYSWDLPGLINGVRFSSITGTEGSIRFETNGLLVIVTGRRSSVSFPGIRDLAGYRAMFVDFIEALRANREPKMTLDMARRDLEIVEEAYRTAG